LNELIETLTTALSQSSFIAYPAAIAWGICSVLLSPCHLASIPIIIAYVNQQDARSARYAAGLSAMFALGVLITIILAGCAAVWAGHVIGGLGSVGNYIVCTVFIVVGLDMVGALSIPWFGSKKEKIKSKGALGALLLGLLLGFAAGPCTFAFLAPILAVTFHAATSNALLGITLIGLFGLGHSAVLVAVGTSAERAAHFARWNYETRTALKVKRILGTLLILAGLYLLYQAL
jgi:cytochrome c-type biogenesis protein